MNGVNFFLLFYFCFFWNSLVHLSFQLLHARWFFFPPVLVIMLLSFFSFWPINIFHLNAKKYTTTISPMKIFNKRVLEIGTRHTNNTHTHTYTDIHMCNAYKSECPKVPCNFFTFAYCTCFYTLTCRSYPCCSRAIKLQYYSHCIVVSLQLVRLTVNIICSNKCTYAHTIRLAMAHCHFLRVIYALLFMTKKKCRKKLGTLENSFLYSSITFFFCSSRS